MTMFLQDKILASGIGPGLAQAMSDAVDLLTASGTIQDDAYEIRNAINRFSTVASGAGAKLWRSAQPGDEILVYNAGANALTIYPNLGSSIDGNAVNASVSVPAGTQARFIRHNASLWSMQSESAVDILFTQSGTGAFPETLQSRGRWTVNITDFMSEVDRAAIRAGNSVDIAAAISLAVAALPTTGGVIDCRMVPAACTWGSTVTGSTGGVTLLLPSAGRITASALPLISVSANASGWEIYGEASGANNGTVLRYTGTAAGDFIAFAKDANYCKVRNLLFECTSALVGRVNAIHGTDIVGFDFDDLFVSDACTSAHVNRLCGVYVEVATTSQVPPRGFGRIGRIIRSSSTPASISTLTGSRGIELKGIAGTNGAIQFVKIDGASNIEDVEVAYRFEKCASVVMNSASFLQGNERDFVLVDCDTSQFFGPYARNNGGFGIEHCNVDSSCSDNFFFCDFGDSGFGTNSGSRTVIWNAPTQYWSFGSIPLRDLLVDAVANTFQVKDSGDGMGMRILINNDSTGFAGFGIRDVANANTKFQQYFQASDGSYNFYLNGATRLQLASGGGVRGLTTSNGPVGTVTLGAGAATTVVSNTSVTASSLIFLFPTSANAAADVAAGNVYISAKSAATSFTITHPNNANADKTFNYLVLN